MSGKRIKYPEEVKRKAVEDFVSGRKTPQQIANEFGFKDSNRIYTWKAMFDEQIKSDRMAKGKKEGIPRELMKRFLELEAENEELKKSLGKQSLIIDLLKKMPGNESVLERDASGLTELIKQSAVKKRRLK